MLDILKPFKLVDFRVAALTGDESHPPAIALICDSVGQLDLGWIEKSNVLRTTTLETVAPVRWQATAYAGGWSDYIAQRPDRAGAEAKPAPKPDTKAGAGAAKPAEKPKAGLSFTEKHRLQALPAEIERLEAEIGKLEQLMADPELFTREPVKFRKATEALVQRQEKLSAAEEEWLHLEEKAEG